MYYPDHHVHCDFSPDSPTPAREQILRAIELGMPCLCFTDHMDYDYPEEANIIFDLKPEIYLPAMRKLKEEFADRIDVRIGMEIGLETCYRDKILSYIDSAPWDFVIGTAASCFAAVAMYLTRKVTIKGYPALSMVMPAIFNGFMVGAMLAYFFGGGFWLNVGCVAAGEIGVLFTLGTGLFYSLRKHKNLFG